MKRNLFLFYLLLSAQWLSAQNNAPAKTAPRPDSAAAILAYNAKGEPGIIISKPGGAQFNAASDSLQVAQLLARKPVAVKDTRPAVKTMAAATPVPAKQNGVKPVAVKPRADTPRLPPQLGEHQLSIKPKP